jgi:hypothetical protein
MKQVTTVVSFVGTPFLDIGPKANEILALGWKFQEMLPDRWTVIFTKMVGPDVNQPMMRSEPSWATTGSTPKRAENLNGSDGPAAPQPAPGR